MAIGRESRSAPFEAGEMFEVLSWSPGRSIHVRAHGVPIGLLAAACLVFALVGGALWGPWGAVALGTIVAAQVLVFLYRRRSEGLLGCRIRIDWKKRKIAVKTWRATRQHRFTDVVEVRLRGYRTWPHGRFRFERCQAMLELLLDGECLRLVQIELPSQTRRIAVDGVVEADDFREAAKRQFRDACLPVAEELASELQAPLRVVDQLAEGPFGSWSEACAA